MADKIEKYNMKNIQVSEDPCSVKEEAVQSSDFEDVKVNISETAIIIGNVELQENKIKQDCTPISLANIKTELSYEVQCNMITDNIKVESENSGSDTKIKFDRELLLYCEQCNVYYEDYCIECGMLIYILNKNVPSNIDSRWEAEPPYNILEIRRDSFGQYGIYALKVIPEGVKFGPFTGLRRSQCPWKIRGGKFVVNKTKKKYLNWMQYVNPARNTSEQNLFVFQFEDYLYYKSTRRIQKGDELLVYFNEECKDHLDDDDVEVNYTPPVENILTEAFACTFCCLGFSSKLYLAEHKAICLADAAGGFSVEELTQCQLCKIYLDQKEYIKHHMAFCCERNVRENIIESYLPEITSSDTRSTQKRRGDQEQHKLTKIVKTKPRCLNTGKTVNATSRKDCRNCYKNKKRVNTTTECKTCPGSPPLCIDCFFELHTCTAK